MKKKISTSSVVYMPNILEANIPEFKAGTAPASSMDDWVLSVGVGVGVAAELGVGVTGVIVGVSGVPRTASGYRLFGVAGAMREARVYFGKAEL